MSETKNPLDRAEKATSLVRNVVIIAGGIASVILFAHGMFNGSVEVRELVVPIRGSKFIVTDADRFGDLAKNLVNAAPSKTPAALPDSMAKYQNQIGRLDSAGSITVENKSNKPVHLVVRLKNVKQSEMDPADVSKGEFMKAHFVLVDVFSSCPLQDKPLIIGDGGFVWPDSTGTIEFKEFPSDCSLTLDVIEVRSSDLIVSVFADGQLLKPSPLTVMFGRFGRYAQAASADPPWSYFFLLIVPIIMLILLSLWATSLITRRDRGGSAEVEEDGGLGEHDVPPPAA